jgi:rhodanese-related sulfurtransferase
VFPTYGEGSFCSATSAGRDTTTIGIEKTESPLYQFTDAESFADDQLSGLLPYPTYYAHMGSINRNNPTATDLTAVITLTADALADHQAAGGAVLDGRERHTHAGGHILGSIGIELGDSFAPWAGWLIEVGTPIALVLDDDQDAIDAVTELSRVGHENIAGVLWGTEAWTESDRALASYRTVTSAELGTFRDPVQVLDVRDPSERAAGHLPDSIHVYVPDLLEGIPADTDPNEPVWVICRSGNRASIAAGVLERYGLDLVVVSEGGVPDLV